MDNTSASYHHLVDELKEKLRISEESRKSLQQKFDAMLQTYKIKEQARYNALRKRYGAFIEEDQRRQQRNENLLQMLERIDNRSASLAARTERLAVLRKHYEQYLGQVYPSWKVTPRLSTGVPPVKIRHYHEEDVSGYGTHTGSSGYVQEPEEPRIPMTSTPKATTHLLKSVQTVLPDKYRLSRADFDTPSISVTKPDDDRRTGYEVRPQKVDVGRYDISGKVPETSRSFGGISPRESLRERTPRGHHLSQPEFEIDQNTSGDLLNMSLSDDGMPSLTRSETDAVARHQHWETLRQAYINRQQQGHRDNDRSSAEESLPDLGWSRQRENLPGTYDHRPIENMLHLQDEPTEQVGTEKESFRDKIRRLKVLIQENKELERSVDGQDEDILDKKDGTWDLNKREDAFQQELVGRQSVVDETGLINDNVYDNKLTSTKNEVNGFQQQRVRRQSVVDGPALFNTQSSENVYPQEDRNLNNNETDNGPRLQRVRRQSVVDGKQNVYPRQEGSVETVPQEDNVNDGRKMAEGTLRRRMSVLPTEQQQKWDSPEERRFEGGIGSEPKRGGLQPLTDNERQENRTLQNTPLEQQQPNERQFHQEGMSRKPSIDYAQDGQFMEENRDFNTNMNKSADMGYTGEQQANEQIQEIKSDNNNKSKTQEVDNTDLSQPGQYRYEREGGDSGPDLQNDTQQPDKIPANQQYYDNNPAYVDGQRPQEQGFYNDPNQNYQGQPQGYDYNQGDGQYDYQYQNQPDNNYYPPQQDPSNSQYDPNQQYPQQYANQYQNQPQPYDTQNQQQYDSQNPQQYDSQNVQQYDNQNPQQYDSQNPQQYDSQNPQQHDSQNPQKYDSQNPQQYDSQNAQQYDNQNPQQYDSQNPQQYDNQSPKQYDSQNPQQYDSQNPQQYDSQNPQQYDNQSPKQYDSQNPQQYDSQNPQQYDSQNSQQYDSQNPQQYDSQNTQQYDSQNPQQYDNQPEQYGGDYGWPQNRNQQEPGQGSPHDQYQYYGQQNQGDGYEAQTQGSNDYENSQQNPSENYETGGSQQVQTGLNEPPQPESSTKFYQDTSEDSTQESDRSRDMQMGRRQDSPSQKSIDRYRTLLGVDPNSDPAYSEVDEIEDEMAAVVASGTVGARTKTADVPDLDISSHNQSKPLETSPKQVHDESSDFDYSSGP